MWTFCSFQFSGPFMDNKNTKKQNEEKKKGLGSPLGGTQSACETASLKLGPSTKEETSNLTAGGSGVASSSLQHTNTAVGGQGVLTKSQKRNRRKGLKKKEKKALVAESTEEGKVGGAKRLRSQASTPSPAQAALSKRPRMENQPRSFAQAVKAVKIAIVRKSFPSEKLSDKDLDCIQVEILKQIDLIPTGDFMPRIQRSALQAGSLIVYCDDLETGDWLKRVFDDNTEVIGGTVLKVMSASELPKPVKVAFKTRDVYTKEPNLLLKRINRLNPELKSEEWRVLHKVVEPHSIRWIFEVDREAADAIRRADFGAYTGLDKGIFKIISDPNTKVKEKECLTETQTTSSQVSDSDTLSDKDSELLKINELEIDTSSEGTLQPNSPLSIDEIEMELQDLNNKDQQVKPLPDVDGKGGTSS